MQRIVSISLMAILLNSCSWLCPDTTAPVNTMSYVNINRYMGKWYEIAAVPLSVQRHCYCSSSNYQRNPEDDTAFEITNTCNKRSPTGYQAASYMDAWSNATTGNSKVRVQVIWPFTHDYWIIYVDKNYQYTLAGTPDRKNFWILARKPQLPKAIYDELVRKAVAQGYSTKYLVMTPQCRADKAIKSVIMNTMKK